MSRLILPILALFTRSVRDDVRAKFPPILRALAVALLLLIIWGNQREFQYSAPGRTLLMMLAMVNLASATILGLGSFSSAITEEKEDETIGLLLMTRLNPLAILMGKSTARLVGGVLFVAAQIPFTMLCVTLGGVTVAQVLHVYAILGAYLAFLCNVCLLCSVFFRRTTLAVIVAFASLLLLYLAPLLMAAMTFRTSAFRGGSPDGWYETLILYLAGANPFMDTGNAIFLSSRLPFATHSIAFNLIGAGLLFLLSWAFFDRFCSAAGEVLPRRRKAGAGVRGRLRFPRVWRRALAWKEFHFMAAGRKGAVIRLTLYVAMIVALLIWMQSVEGRVTKGGVANLTLWTGKILFVVELGAAAARIFGNERRERTLGSLIALPVTTKRLIWEKVQGCLLVVLPSLIIWVVGALVYQSWERDLAQEWGPSRSYISERDSVETTLYLLQYVELAFFAVLVAYLSLRLRRAPLLTGIGIIIFLNVLSGILAGLLGFHSKDDFVGWLWFCMVAAGVATFVLAAAIPGRLALCAAEE